MWQIEILANPPVSGSVAERHFRCDAAESSRWVWVSFESDLMKWCGSFRASSHGPIDKAVLVGDHAIIVAGGVCYCVALEQEAVQFTLASSSYTDVIAIPHIGRAALADFDAVTIVNVAGVEWVSPRIAWDGLRFIAATGSTIIGVAETGHGAFDERRFEIDLATREVFGGYVNDFRR